MKNRNLWPTCPYRSQRCGRGNGSGGGAVSGERRRGKRALWDEPPVGPRPRHVGARPRSCRSVRWLVGQLVGGSVACSSVSALMFEGGRDTGAARTPEPPGEELRTQVSGLSPLLRPAARSGLGAPLGHCLGTGEPLDPRASRGIGIGVNMGSRACPSDGRDPSLLWAEDWEEHITSANLLRISTQPCPESRDSPHPYRCQDVPGDALGGRSPQLCMVFQSSAQSAGEAA